MTIKQKHSLIRTLYIKIKNNRFCLHSNKTTTIVKFIYYKIKKFLVVKYLNVGLTIYKLSLLDGLYIFSYIRSTEGYHE